ncbi:hypothetical protein [Pedobacter namyangjuensis]|uniref:hypothetical protein n=1 Tax=Pedobacter namyangjuensis TaxID=600626 RepID=UPI0013B3F29A|nr:hypothetical protein [Pedobacter namyangjuensis]
MKLSGKNSVTEALQKESNAIRIKQILAQTTYYGNIFTKLKKNGRYNESFSLHHKPSKA